MPDNLPEGYTSRPAALADAEAILALVVEHNLTTIGVVDNTLDDVRNELAEPGFTPDTDTWLVHDAGGALVGYGWAWRHGTGELVDVDVITMDDAVRGWLYDRVLGRAKEMARGHERFSIDQGIFRVDTSTQAAAAAYGFEAATTFHRMRVDHSAEAVDPVAPPGVTLRTGPGDEHFRRTAHTLVTDSFKDHYGFVERTFDHWHESLDRESTFDWSGLAVASLDGHPVAVLLTNDRYLETDNCGYVAVIGVLPEARGRGIAKYLLRTAFAADIRAARTGTILHVDTNNTTPALTLYEGVGMRPVLIIDMWRRVMDSTTATPETAQSPGRS